MRVTDIGSALSNPTRVKLVQILSSGPISATEAHRRYTAEYEQKHRESVYRELENLVSAGLVVKAYSSAERVLVYELIVQRITLEFGSEVTVEVDATE